jgi:hypothetical protein
MECWSSGVLLESVESRIPLRCIRATLASGLITYA